MSHRHLWLSLILSFGLASAAAEITNSMPSGAPVSDSGGAIPAANGAAGGAAAGGAAAAGENGPKPGQASPTTDIGGMQCMRASRTSASQCGSYLNSADGGSGKSEQVDLQSGIRRISSELQQQINASREKMNACVSAANSCREACNNAGGENSRAQCTLQKSRAIRKHSNLTAKFNQQRQEYDRSGELSGSRRDDDRQAGEPSPSSPGSGPAGQTTPPSSNTNPTPQSVKNTTTPSQTAPKDNQPERTAEQQKQERQEKRAEERRQERIDALGKAFMTLNQQQKVGQALQERSSSPETQAAMVAAAKVADKISGAASAGKSVKKDDEDENGRAGFNALAKQNLAARKAIAASLGINSAHLPGAPALKTASVGGGGQGTIFAAGRGFEHSAEQASLDPIREPSQESNLPRNFQLGTPSAGGGGGGSLAAAGDADQKPQRRKSTAANALDDSDTPARGPAGLEDTAQILRPSADIWAVMSTAFRTRCAEGRLMDCAEHLPKH